MNRMWSSVFLAAGASGKHQLLSCFSLCDCSYAPVALCLRILVILESAFPNFIFTCVHLQRCFVEKDHICRCGVRTSASFRGVNSAHKTALTGFEGGAPERLNLVKGVHMWGLYLKTMAADQGNQLLVSTTETTSFQKIYFLSMRQSVLGRVTFTHTAGWAWLQTPVWHCQHEEDL
jgi:hypothetical protein